MKWLIREFMTYNAREKRGILVLLFAVFFLFSALHLKEHLYSGDPRLSGKTVISGMEGKEGGASEARKTQERDSSQALKTEGEAPSYEKKEKDARKWEEREEEKEHPSFDKGPAHENAGEKKLEPVEFDPNEVSVGKLREMGLTEGQAAVIVNYRKQVKPYRKPADLLKVYSVDTPLFESLRGYIRMEEASNRKAKVALNTADTNALRTLNGIGPVFSKRILKYRDLIGGFTRVDQLAEVYGIRDSLVRELKPALTVDKAGVRRIGLNNASFKDLAQHPYIDGDKAGEILRLRSEYGDLEEPRVLNKTGVIGDSLWTLLKPYLEVNNDVPD